MGMNCKPRCGKIVVLIIIGLAALGWVVMQLWNSLMPAMFPGVREITYWQAIGVLLLSKILFGSFRGHWRCMHHSRWENMTPEEREKLMHNLDRRCCGKKSEDTASPRATTQD